MTTTTTSSDSPAWIGDGSCSSGGRLDASADATSTIISFASATQGTPFNIRLDGPEGAPAGDSYYEVQVTSLSKGSSLAVGFVTSSGFLPGWKTRGCFYNGNITNGSAGLIIGFGGRVQEGDTVGAYLRHVVGGVDERRKCEIVFYHNGWCLGAGFSLEDSGEQCYPCLHLSGGATVRYAAPPPPTLFARKVEGHGGDPYAGQWAIEQAFSGPELDEVPIPAGAKCTLSFERVDAATPSTTEGAEYQISAKADNSFHTTLAITGKMEAFDRIQFAGPCRATLMMPRLAFQELERLIQQSLSPEGGWTKMIVSDGKLVVSGPTSEVVCSRYVERFEPVTSL